MKREKRFNYSSGDIVLINNTISGTSFQAEFISELKNGVRVKKDGRYFIIQDFEIVGHGGVF